MVATIDGHTLDECIYKGSWIKDNKPLINSLPPTCFGVFISETTIMHRFEHVNDANKNFDLFEDNVECTIIKDLSATETVVKKRLKLGQ